MGIEPKFTKAQIRTLLLKKINRINTAIENRFIRTGEQFVRDARDVNTYKDRTGNLRSSIAYIALNNGIRFAENFKATASGKTVRYKNRNGEVRYRRKKYAPKKGVSGTSAAQRKANRFERRYKKGYALVCFAGMDYARHVENKGYDVITTSKVRAKRELRNGLRQLRKNILQG